MAQQGNRQGQPGSDRQQNPQGGAAGQAGPDRGASRQQNEEGQNQSAQAEGGGGRPGQENELALPPAARQANPRPASARGRL